MKSLKISIKITATAIAFLSLFELWSISNAMVFEKCSDCLLHRCVVNFNCVIYHEPLPLQTISTEDGFKFKVGLRTLDQLNPIDNLIVNILNGNKGSLLLLFQFRCNNKNAINSTCSHGIYFRCFSFITFRSDQIYHNSQLMQFSSCGESIQCMHISYALNRIILITLSYLLFLSFLSTQKCFPTKQFHR